MLKSPNKTRGFDKEVALALAKKWAFSIVLFVFGLMLLIQFWKAINVNIIFAVRYEHAFPFSWIYFILDTFTLIIHEAGHTFFSFTGSRFWTILGGSLLQLMIPFAIFVVGWINKNTILAQFGLFWVGFSWLETAAYCSDAVYANLPLIGGLGKSAHDFKNLLTMTDTLRYYEIFAFTMYLFAIFCFLVAIFLPKLKPQESEYVVLDLGLD